MVRYYPVNPLFDLFFVVSCFRQSFTDIHVFLQGVSPGDNAMGTREKSRQDDTEDDRYSSCQPFHAYPSCRSTTACCRFHPSCIMPVSRFFQRCSFFHSFATTTFSFRMQLPIVLYMKLFFISMFTARPLVSRVSSTLNVSEITGQVPGVA